MGKSDRKADRIRQEYRREKVVIKQKLFRALNSFLKRTNNYLESKRFVQ